MYESKTVMTEKVIAASAACVRWSKIIPSETPYDVTGAIQHTGSKEHLRVYAQIEIAERGKTRTWSGYTL